jgi:protein-S-isoprenylcysteine O-methyltransferase Ste14
MIPWGVSMLTPRYGWANGHPGIWNLPGLVLISTGGVVLVWLLLTTMVYAPKEVHLGPAPSWLVTRGPYALTRNPMYLAELGVWLGWAIFFGSISVLIGFVIFGLTVDRMVLPQEERTLETAFGQSYLRYKESVPRWLGKRARS